MMQGIYRIKNKVNGKCYIGSSNNIKHRWSVHKSTLRRGCHYNVHLQRAWDKYGKRNFTFSVIEENEKASDLLSREQWYLDNCKPEYNISKDATAPRRGKSHTEEWKRNVSKKLTGRKFTEEHRARLSEAQKGTTLSKETKKRISDNNAQYWKGKKRSAKDIQKMKDNACRFWKGKQFSKEHLSRLSLAQTGENNGNAKLTTRDVKKIRKAYAAGKYTYKELGIIYGVSLANIGDIVNRKTWKNI
ncbi:MAG: GIY-YIG nuclease family protein [Candidatus Auribacterota bacterium]|nr:GIY-YIG nuclease family protein [Candidatus Auribacterota bacterium]